VRKRQKDFGISQERLAIAALAQARAVSVFERRDENKASRETDLREQ
jgi:hypothetical protein